MKNFGVYILKSLKDNSYYIGSTDNIERRFHQHSSGFSYSTKNLRPLVLARFMTCDSLKEARQFEYRLKKYKRKDIIEKIVVDGIFPWNH